MSLLLAALAASGGAGANPGPAAPTRPASLDGPLTARLASWSRVSHHKSQSPTTSTTPHVMATDAQGIRLAVGNVTGSGGGVYAVGPNDVLWSATVTVRGVTRAVTWSGADQITVTPGQIATSDPVEAWAAQGETVQVTMTGIAPSGGTVPTMEGWSDGSGGYLAGPLAVIADTPDATAEPRWLLLGDSVTEGVGDDLGGRGGTYGTGGYFARILDQRGEAYLNAGASGERYMQLDGLWDARIGALAAYCDRAIVGYCINDLMAYTATQNADAFIERWHGLLQRGLRVWQVTVLPRTNADGTVPDTGSGRDAERAAWNAWLRDGAPGWWQAQYGRWQASPTGSTAADTVRIGGTDPAGGPHPLAGVLDVAAIASPPGSPDVWRTGWTQDGVHPSPTGHAGLAAALDLPA